MAVVRPTELDAYSSDPAANTQGDAGITNNTRLRNVDDVIRRLMGAVKGWADAAWAQIVSIDTRLTTIEADSAEAETDIETNADAIEAGETRLDAIEADGWVATDRILDAAVTSGKISTNSIGFSHFTQGAVRTAAIQDRAVTRAKLDDDAVGTTQLAQDAVTTRKIKDGAVTRQKIEAGLVPFAQTTAAQNFAGGTTSLVWPQSFAAQPHFCQVWMRCRVADAGYAVGDTILVPDSDDISTSVEFGSSAVVSPVGVRVQFARGGVWVLNKSTGAGQNAQANHWEIFATGVVF